MLAAGDVRHSRPCDGHSPADLSRSPGMPRRADLAFQNVKSGTNCARSAVFASAPALG
jgi:hypothetical protein